MLPYSSVQGSFNRPHMESSSRNQSLSVESSLKGLQVELSETCALCLSRLLNLICVPLDSGPQLPDVASVSPSAEDAAPMSSPLLHLLFKLDCCLEDVNVFTRSNLAGKRFQNMEDVTLAKSECFSLQGQLLFSLV